MLEDKMELGRGGLLHGAWMRDCHVFTALYAGRDFPGWTRWMDILHGRDVPKFDGGR